MATIAEMIKSEYPKIETLYNRNPENLKHVVMGELRMDEFGLVDRWHVTEKIHGTNIRVIYRDGQVIFGGKTDNAQMPLYLLEALRPMFPVDRFAEIWPTDMGEPTAEPGDGPFAQVTQPYVVLYGEGYGAKIQKGGGNYRSDQSFRLFDVAVMGEDRATGQPKWWWLEWENVAEIATRFDILTVPVIDTDVSTARAIELVRSSSEVASIEGNVVVDHEGIVCRTVPQLYTRSGKRLIWKLKISDLPEEA